jgi:uncharacterized protein YqjF (DUF2071 family)
MTRAPAASPARPRELLADATHRPTPLPRGPWVMFQRWHELLFAHWAVPSEPLRARLPAGLELDTFAGEAWLGLVPFRMSAVRLRGTPALPGVSAFPELNLRTYVRHGAHRGVWFFSLDAASRIGVRIARAWFHLPYFDARMACEEHAGEVRYRSLRTHRGAPPAELVARYAPVAPVERARPETLEHFLTERYCLFTADARGRLLRGDIHHRPWPLQRARAELERDTLAEASGLARPVGAPLLHYAHALDVLIFPLRRA